MAQASVYSNTLVCVLVFIEGSLI